LPGEDLGVEILGEGTVVVAQAANGDVGGGARRPEGVYIIHRPRLRVLFAV
jgi:hypothetical protein